MKNKENETIIFNVLKENGFEQFEPEFINNLIPDSKKTDFIIPISHIISKNKDNFSYPFKRFYSLSESQLPLNAHIISENRLKNEIEILKLIDSIYSKLNTKIIIKINNIKLLSGIAERIGFPDKDRDLILKLSELNKTGQDIFKDRLLKVGFSEDSVNLTETILNLNGSYNNQMQCIEKFLGETDSGIEGIIEIEKIFTSQKLKQFYNKIKLDIKLSSENELYKGTIFNVVSANNESNILCTGGSFKLDLDNFYGINFIIY